MYELINRISLALSACDVFEMHALFGRPPVQPDKLIPFEITLQVNPFTWQLMSREKP